MRYQHLLHYAEGSFALTLVVGVILAGMFFTYQPTNHFLFEMLTGKARQSLAATKSPSSSAPSPGLSPTRSTRRLSCPTAEKHLAFLDGMLATSPSAAGDEEGEGYLCGRIPDRGGYPA